MKTLQHKLLKSIHNIVRAGSGKIKLTVLSVFTFLLFAQTISAHGVQVAWCLQDNGFIRVYVEHWHGDLSNTTSAGTMQIATSINNAPPIIQTLYPTGIINNTTLYNLSGCGPNIISIGGCSGGANSYNDWVYFDFAPPAFGQPITVSLQAGNTVVLTEACGSLYPTDPNLISATFVDTQGPEITCNDVNVESCGENVFFSASVVDNSDPNPIVTYTPASGSYFGPGTTQVRVDAVDNLGNEAEPCFFNVTVVNQSPGITNCPQTQYVQFNTDDGVCTFDYDYNLTISGIPAPTVTYTFSGATDSGGPQPGTGSGSSFNIGLTSVTVTATNDCGVATCTFPVTVLDTEEPTVVTQDITVYLDQYGQVSISPEDVDFGSSDNCGPVSLSFSNDGTICGTAVENQSIYMVAPAGAVFTSVDFASYGTPYGSCGSFSYGWCHSGISMSQVSNYLIGNNAATIPATNSVFGDPCGGTVKRLYVQATYEGGSASESNFTCSMLGENVVTLKVTDLNGNVATKTAIVTVVDDETPTLTCPPDVTVNCEDNNSSSTTGVAIAGDNCSAVVTQSDVSTQVSDLSSIGHYNYTITRTWTATDPSLNSIDCDQTITVQDVTAPFINCPQDVTVNCQDDTDSSFTGVATGSDNCSAVTITQSDVSNQNSDLGDEGHYNYTITRTWTATDVTGNTTSCDQVITVQDVTAPSIDCPANVTLSCDDDHSPSNTGMASGSDNCSAVTIEYADASTQDADENAAGHYNYTITRTWTATDVTGNAISCDQVITVQDVTAPSITCPADITVDCEEDNSSSSTGMATGDDNCSAVTISETSVSTQDADENSSGHYNYTITRSWTATDVTGNAISCDQVITVQDVTSPNVACQSLTVYLDEAGVASVTADDIDNGTEDNCSSFTLTLDGVLDYACEDRDSSFVVTLTATDISGNSSSCTATVTVSDDTLPDDDCDGVSNVCDVCPGGDDSIDNNDDGIADCSQLLNYNDYDSDWYCGNNKIRICHTPPGNQNNPQSICVNKNSLPSHLAHGDAVGPCTSCETNDMVILDSDGKHSTIDASDFGLDGFGIGLYPNPASDKLQIYLTASEFPTKLSIYDVYGKKVWEQEVKPGKVNVEVDLSAKQFSNGMYTVNAYNEIGSQTKQLIITK